jgi:hypothetical protein
MDHRAAYGASIQRREFGFEPRHYRYPLFDITSTAGRDAYHHVAPALNPAKDFMKDIQISGGLAGLWISSMDVSNGCPGFVRPHRIIGYLLGRQREILRHTGCVGRTGNRSGDDHFTQDFFMSHPITLFFVMA